MKVTGFRDLEKQLAKLPASTAKGVARRVMKRSLAPVAETANAFWPGARDDVFRITSKLARSQPRAKSGRSIVNMFIGANRAADGGARQAHLIEWGTGPRFQKGGKYTGSVAAQPMLTPAWEMHKDTVLRELGRLLGEEIEKSLARRAAKGQ